MSGSAIADAPVSQAPSTAPTPAVTTTPTPPATAPAAASTPARTPASAPAAGTDSKIPEPARPTETPKPGETKPASVKDLLSDPPADPAKPADAKPTDAPAADAWELKVEGVAPEVLKQTTEWAKAQGLNQKQAEAALARETAANTARETASKAALGNFFSAQRESFQKDPEFGGPKFEQSVAHIERALNKLGDPELTAVVTNPDSPFLKYAPFARLLAKAGALLGEDGALPSGHAPNKPRNDGELFYGPKKS